MPQERWDYILKASIRSQARIWEQASSIVNKLDDELWLTVFRDFHKVYRKEILEEMMPRLGGVLRTPKALVVYNKNITVRIHYIYFLNCYQNVLIWPRGNIIISSDIYNGRQTVLGQDLFSFLLYSYIFSITPHGRNSHRISKTELGEKFSPLLYRQHFLLHESSP